MSKKQEIENQIISMIRQGVLAPGERLPSIRRMAQEYNVSMTPVTDAYSELVATRWLESRPNSGFYVSEQPGEQAAQNTLSLNASEHYGLLDDFLSGYSQIAVNSSNNIRFPFGTTSTNIRMYQEPQFNQFLIRAVQSPSISGSGLIELHDEADLKRGIMKWMLACRCKNSVEDISIVHSVTEGLLLAVRACARPGSTIAVEAPGHAGFYFISHFLDCRVLPVPSRPDTGLDIDAFEAMLRSGSRPACLLLCANFSNPTGALMPDSGKQRLAKLCAEFAVPIIEDDVLGELYFGDTRPLPLKSFDNENVIYVSGFGKCLNPVLRMGYVSAGRYRDAFAFQKHLAVSYTNPYLQRALSNYLESGQAGRHAAAYRSRLKKNVGIFREKLLDAFPAGTEAAMPAGGPYLWVTLPDGIDAEKLCSRAISCGISIAPGRLYNAAETQKNAFRFNCGTVAPDADSLKAVETLSQLAVSLLTSQADRRSAQDTPVCARRQTTGA